MIFSLSNVPFNVHWTFIFPTERFNGSKSEAAVTETLVPRIHVRGSRCVKQFTGLVRVSVCVVARNVPLTPERKEKSVPPLIQFTLFLSPGSPFSIGGIPGRTETGRAFFLSFRKFNSCLPLPSSSHGILSDVFTLKYVFARWCVARTRVPQGTGGASFARLKESVSTGSHGKKACTRIVTIGPQERRSILRGNLDGRGSDGSCLTIMDHRFHVGLRGGVWNQDTRGIPITWNLRLYPNFRIYGKTLRKRGRFLRFRNSKSNVYVLKSLYKLVGDSRINFPRLHRAHTRFVYTWTFKLLIGSTAIAFFLLEMM